MPPQKKQKAPSQRPQRCKWNENGVRCMRNGDPLCRAHAVVANHAAAQGAGPANRAKVSVQSVFERLGDLAHTTLDDLMAGRPINKQKIATAINEAAWEMGGAYTGYHPPLEDVPLDPFGNGAGPQQHRRPPPRRPGWGEPEDPAAAELREKLEAASKARVVLGFGPRDEITADVLKKRHRELVKKHHPDRGGSVTRMAEINNAVDAITAVL